jgi:hypothetical protein
MAINPNTDFSSGAILTAAQQNRFPRGVMALATSSTSYVLTTTLTATTGMSVTFTAVANRYYKITYYEPQAQTAAAASTYTELDIRLTNAAGASQGTSLFFTPTATLFQSGITVVATKTFSAGSVTLVGCALSSSITGAPNLIRTAPRASILLVEDIGPA